MKEKINFESATRSFKQVNGNYLYCDKQFELKGIDYKKFMRIRFETVNYNLIKEIYTVKGWYLLTYLIVNAHSGQYVKTTINIIAEDTKLKSVDIKKLLESLNKNQTVIINIANKKTKEITYNTPIELFITYNTTDYYNSPVEIDETKQGYRIIPIDYIRTILPTMTPEQWSIYSVLVVRYNFYTINKNYDDSGKPYYTFKENKYSFPTIEQISKHTGIPNTTIRRQVNKLEKNKYKILHNYSSKQIIVYTDKNGDDKCKMSNRIYYLTLFQRIEYIYNCIINLPDNRSEDKKKLIKNKGFEKIRKTDNYYILRDRDYLNTYYKALIEEYKKAMKVNKEDKELGKELYKDVKQYEIK